MSLTLTAAVRANKPQRNVNIIFAANGWSAAIQKNGKAWGWGFNSFGQLGDNSIIQRFTPVRVLGAEKIFCKIGSVGAAQTVNAIDNSGLVWSWGAGANGQLGNNTTTASQLTPVSIGGARKTFCEISSGGSYCLGIDKNGRAWGWGYNGNGRIGDNSITQRLTPVSILGTVKTFCKISAGNFSSLAVDKNGRAWAWGNNSSGELGDNSITSRLTPVSVLGAVKTFCKISGGNSFFLAIDKNGRAWAWGVNSNGQLGDNSITSRRTPVSVLGAVKTFCQISAGSNFSLAIDKNGRAWGWGSNSAGQLGDNSITSRLTPVSVLGAVKTFCKIIVGTSYSLAIDKNGRAWAWGYNVNGELGDNLVSRCITPVSVLGAVKTFCKISAGGSHSLAIDKNGRAWGWGATVTGAQVGDNGSLNTRTPVSVVGNIKTFCEISAGYTHSLAIDKNGRAWGWGVNSQGRIGDNTTTSRFTPVSILGAVKTFCKISAGGSHSLAIDKNGRAWGWGLNTVGRIGDNTQTSRLTPVSVLGAVKTFCEISAGTNHSVAIDKNGRAWAWGGNATGQLGDNSITSRVTPVSVLGAVKTFCRINANAGVTSSFCLAIDKNGRAWAWGANFGGGLGDNSTTSRLTPVSVLGAVKTFCKISGGFVHSLAIDKNGRAWAWGTNDNGELGDNSTTGRLTPVSVLGAVKTFCEISAGNNHSLAIDKNGRAWAWGAVSVGRLGINKDVSERTPVRICNI